MSGFLLDTNVLSEYNKRESPNLGVIRWIESTPEREQYVSVLTLAEIEKGILRLPHGKRRRDLERWLAEDLPARFENRILDFDQRVASRWAKLVASFVAVGRNLPTVDSQIAATALAHGLALVTRNVRDFDGLGLTIYNPWQSA